MRELFASLYEWFGLLPFYSADLGEHLRGFDITCSDYLGTPLYMSVGISMILVTLVCYALQYHAINSPKFNKRIHWFVTAAAAATINFLIAFTLSYKDVRGADFCSQLRLTIVDCAGFALSNAIWSLIIFLLITSFPYPRKLAGYNVTETTFWKPKS